MPDYISRAAANNKIMENIVHQESHDANLHNIGLRKAMSVIDSLPAADVVEVVRCRECKHSVMYKFTYNYERVLVCNAPGVTIRAVKPMHFCADGKRKDGGHDE